MLIRFICVIRVPIRLLVLTARHAKEKSQGSQSFVLLEICVCFSIIDKKIRVNPFYLRYPRTNQVVSFNRKARKGKSQGSQSVVLLENLCLFFNNR